jgi:hypothetical protein
MPWSAHADGAMVNACRRWSMLATASDANFDDLPLTSFLVFSAMGGVMRATLEGGASPRMVRPLRRQLALLCRGFLISVAVEA